VALSAVVLGAVFVRAGIASVELAMNELHRQVAERTRVKLEDYIGGALRFNYANLTGSHAGSLTLRTAMSATATSRDGCRITTRWQRPSSARPGVSSTERDATSRTRSRR